MGLEFWGVAIMARENTGFLCLLSPFCDLFYFASVVFIFYLV